MIHLFSLICHGIKSRLDFGIISIQIFPYRWVKQLNQPVGVIIYHPRILILF